MTVFLVKSTPGIVPDLSTMWLSYRFKASLVRVFSPEECLVKVSSCILLKADLSPNISLLRPRLTLGPHYAS